MRAARLAAATTLPALALLPLTTTTASAATFGGDGAGPLTVDVAGAPASTDGTTLLLDPDATAQPLSVSGCASPSTLRWVLYPNQARSPLDDGHLVPPAPDGRWSTTLDLAAEVAAWDVSDPASQSWTLGVACDSRAGTTSVLLPVLLSPETAGSATEAASAVPGAVVRASASGMAPGEAVLIRLVPTAPSPAATGSEPTGTVLATTTATGSGSAGADVILPASTAPGAYTLELLGTSSATRSSRPLTVLTADGATGEASRKAASAGAASTVLEQRSTAQALNAGTEAGTQVPAPTRGTAAVAGTERDPEPRPAPSAQVQVPATQRHPAGRTTLATARQGSLARAGAPAPVVAAAAIGVVLLGAYLVRHAGRCP